MRAVLDFYYQYALLFELIIFYIPFAVAMKRRKYFIFILLLCLAILWAVDHFTPRRLKDLSFAGGMVYAIFLCLFIFVLTVIAAKACFKESWWKVVFCGVSAYAMQHIAYRINIIIRYFFGTAGINNAWIDVTYFTVLALAFVCGYFAFRKKCRSQREFETHNKELILISFVLISVTVILSVIGGRYIRLLTEGDNALTVLFSTFSVVACVILLMNLFSNVQKKRDERELQMIHNLWKSDRKQYELAKQTVDILNIKFHDLKYQLGAAVQSSSALAEVNQSLDIYNSLHKTGNETLDVVLTEKSLTCLRLNIQLACIADGRLISQMNAVDIYSLFGNAIDNAIECLKGVEETEKKVININVEKMGGMARIQIQNYSPNSPVMENGLPMTTKRDKDNHGYGLKSIRYIVKKYMGNMMVNVAGNIFSLTIALPEPA